MGEVEFRKSQSVQDRAIQWMESARWSPSGGNSQPWFVEFDASFDQVAFRISIDPSAQETASLMDVDGMASVLALGCFCETLILAAKADSFQLLSQKVMGGEVFWFGSIDLLFGRSKVSNQIDDFSQSLQTVSFERRTHRGIFIDKALPENFLGQVRNILGEFQGLKYSMCEPKDQSLYRSLSQLEKIRWGHLSYLKSLLSEVSFCENESQYENRIPSSQLGISSFDRFTLRLFKKFPHVSAFFLKMGFARIPVHKSIGRFVNNCEKMIFLQSLENSFGNIFELGRCFQRLWLFCASEQIAFQPNGTPLIALGYWHSPQKSHLSQKYSLQVEQATQIFQNQYGLDLRKFTIGFRLGYSDEKVSQCPRKKIKFQRRTDLLQSLRKDLT